MIELRVETGLEAEAALRQIKLMATRFPGEHELRIVVETTTEGERALRLGPMWRYDASSACLAALGEFGEVVFPVV